MAQDDSIAILPVAVPPGAEPRFSSDVVTALSGRRTQLTLALDTLLSRPTIIAEVASRLVATLRSGHKILVAGNGGSAAEAQHFAAELVGRFKREREPYAALALTADSSTLTAVANDYGYEQVFARQVAAFGRPGDLLLAFSTSGESKNVVEAATVARQRGLIVVAVTGQQRSRLERLSDLTVRTPSEQTELIQELHMLLTHIFCDIVERELAATEGDRLL